MGDEVTVKVMDLTPDGKISLSMKDAPGNVYPERPAHNDRPPAPPHDRGPRKPFRPFNKKP